MSILAEFLLHESNVQPLMNADQRLKAGCGMKANTNMLMRGRQEASREQQNRDIKTRESKKHFFLIFSWSGSVKENLCDISFNIWDSSVIPTVATVWGKAHLHQLNVWLGVIFDQLSVPASAQAPAARWEQSSSAEKVAVNRHQSDKLTQILPLLRVHEMRSRSAGLTGKSWRGCGLPLRARQVWWEANKKTQQKTDKRGRWRWGDTLE